MVTMVIKDTIIWIIKHYFLCKKVLILSCFYKNTTDVFKSSCNRLILDYLLNFKNITFLRLQLQRTKTLWQYLLVMFFRKSVAKRKFCFYKFLKILSIKCTWSIMIYNSTSKVVILYFCSQFYYIVIDKEKNVLFKVHTNELFVMFK